MRIDESLMNLCEILDFQPKGVATLSLSSRKRPAYAGMTVRDAWNDGDEARECGYAMPSSNDSVFH